MSVLVNSKLYRYSYATPLHGYREFINYIANSVVFNILKNSMMDSASS